MATKYVVGRGSYLNISTDGGTTWLPIKQLKSIAYPTSKADFDDITNMDSGNWREYAPTANDAGTVELLGVWAMDDPGQMAASTAFDNQTRCLFQHQILPSATVPQSFLRSFTGYMAKKPNIDARIDKASQYAATIRVTGPYTDVFSGSGGASTDNWVAALVGAFTDSSGSVIQPIYIANGGTFTVPPTATQLQLGVNDDKFADNTGGWTITVDGTSMTIPPKAMPWLQTGGLNSDYPYGIQDGVSPVVLSVLAGEEITIAYVSGTINIGPGWGNVDAAGYVGVEGKLPGTTGTRHPSFYM